MEHTPLRKRKISFGEDDGGRSPLAAPAPATVPYEELIEQEKQLGKETELALIDEAAELGISLPAMVDRYCSDVNGRLDYSELRRELPPESPLRRHLPPDGDGTDRASSRTPRRNVGQ